MGGKGRSDNKSSSSSSSNSRKSRLDKTANATSTTAGAGVSHAPLLGGASRSSSRGLGGSGAAVPYPSSGVTGGGGFIGFSAYASAPSFSSPATATTAATTAATANGGPLPFSNALSEKQWGPVYTGNDAELRAIFHRIVNKRDAVTKCRALDELAAYLDDPHRPKRDQADAISHFAYHFVIGTRLAHALFGDGGGGGGGGSSSSDRRGGATAAGAAGSSSSASAVRAGCVRVWGAALRRVPKATLGVAQAHPDVAGVLESWRCDPSSAVRAVANDFDRQQRQLLEQQSTTTSAAPGADASTLTTRPSSPGASLSSSSSLTWPAAEGLASYSRQILSYPNSAALYEGFMRAAAGGGTPTALLSGGPTGRRQQQGTPPPPPPTSGLAISSPSTVKDLSDAQKEALEETYVRLLTTVLSALAMNLSSSEATTTVADASKPETGQHTDAFRASDVALWCKSLLAHSPGVRRCAYQLLSAVALLPPDRSLLLRPPDASRDDSSQPPLATLINTLVQALGQERQPGNVPGLLELVLATTTAAASAALSFTTSSQEATILPNASALERPTAKLVRKAGYGARVDQWGPGLLPLASQASQPLGLVIAIKDGRASTFGQRDAAGLLVAQIECATYLLLRAPPSPPRPNKGDDDNNNDKQEDSSDAHALVDLWIDAYEATLQQQDGADIAAITPSVTTPSSSSSSSNRRPAPSAGSHALQQLVAALAKSWVRLEAASLANRRCEFQNVRQSLWDRARLSLVGDGVVAATAGGNSNDIVQVPMITLFVASVRDQIQEPVGRDRRQLPNLTAALKRYLEINLRPFQASSSVPTLESYELYHQVLALADEDPSHVLPTPAERFVMNDLLRWTVIHTSELSTKAQSTELVQHDFALLARLAADPSVQNSEGTTPVARQLWPSFLSELIKAKVDVGWLVVGLRTLLQHGSAHALDWLPCTVLDEYATSSAVLGGRTKQYDSSEGEFQEDEASLESTEDSTVARDRLDFFRLCLGVDLTSFSHLLVSRSVVSQWLERLCFPSADLIGGSASSGVDSFLMTAMLEAVSKNPQVLDPEDTLRLLVAAWLSGRSLFRVQSLGLSIEASVMHSFLGRASGLLIQRLELLASLSDASLGTNPRVLASWIASAWSLLEVLDQQGEEHRLDLLGLSNVQFWKDRPELLFHLLTNLLGKYEDPRARYSLIASSTYDAEKLLATALLTASDASVDATKACRVKSPHDRSAMLLRALGGMEIDAGTLDKLVDHVISTLVDCLKDGDGQNNGGARCTTQACVTVLSQLLSTRFRSVRDSASVIPDPQTVHKGDTVWYIADPNDDNSSRLARVVKVHHEADVGYFFTICFDESGEYHERQTVINRLRLVPITSASVPWSEISEEEQNTRARVRSTLIHDIIVPFGSPERWATLVLELIPIVCGTVGVGPERGLGTDHYLLVHLVQDVSRRLLVSCGSDQADTASQMLYALSLSLGYGLHVPSAPTWTMQQLSFDVIPTLDMLTGFYQRISVGSSPVLDRAALMWLSTAFDSNHGLYDTKSIDSALPLLFQLARESLRGDDRGRTFTDDHVSAVRALYVGMTCTMSEAALSGALVDVAARAIRTLLQTFCRHWPDHVEHDAFGNALPYWRLCTPFLDIIAMCHSKPKLRPLFMDAIDASLCESMSECLFVESKRHACMYLLDSRLRMGKPLFQDSQLTAETSDRLEEWVNDLEDEEADEVRDDVAIVAPYLPRRLMWEMEDWGEKLYEDTEEAVMLGRLLMWLCVLGVVDAVSPQGFRFRPAFVSYLHRSGAANAALNLALLHDEAINETRGMKPPSLLDVDLLHGDESFVLVPKVSSLVLFQTVEVLPSLSRRWWEESCPKPYIADVQRFVEQFVAPAIFERELARIREPSSLSASSSSPSTGRSFGGMQIKSSLHKREVTASYVQDDFTLSVTIAMPPNFPLKSANVDCSQTLGVPQQRWKRWSLQITLMLNSEGGTLQDALLLWKDNVDREFDGVEPCPVCYSVLHVKTHKLPSLECTTCRHRFHVDCLMQWFRSSGKSSCVLCQQPWQGTRV